MRVVVAGVGETPARPGERLLVVWSLQGEHDRFASHNMQTRNGTPKGSV